jgi:hypothetical protein
MDTELHFRNHVRHIFSYCIKLLGLIRSITTTFSPLEFMHRLHIMLVRSELEYASIVWNSITSTDSNKLVRIQQRLAAHWFNRFLSPLLLFFCYEGVKIARFAYEEASPRCTLPYSNLSWF